MKDKEIKLVGGFGKKCNNDTQYHYQNRVYDSKCLCTALSTTFQPYYLTHTHTQESKMELRIRKLVPLETLKLMGFERKDYQAMRDIGQSDMQIYHECGDSIVTTCLMAIFGQMLFDEEELNKKIENYVEQIKEN